MDTATLQKPTAQDFCPILGTDYIEFFVGNAKQAAYYYKAAFGFQSLAYRGLETGVRDRASYAVRQGKITLVFTTPLHPGNDMAHHLAQHGDAVKSIAFWVEDAEQAWKEAIFRGARSFMQPEILQDEFGKIKQAGIHTYGDTVHMFIERKDYRGVFLPGFVEWKSEFNPPEIGLKYVDHCVGNVDWGQMNHWAGFYQNVLGFSNLITFDDKDISTQYTALMSKVMQNHNGRIRFPINEPAMGAKKSQIEEFIEFNHGPGCQHIAVATDDIIFTVSELRRRGVEFLYVPGDYYDTVSERVGEIREDLEVLKSLGIMVDRDDEGYLLQIFTKPVEDRPTLFYEIIERVGAKSFGKGNFQALFESIEAEQARRGTL
ncbi:MAG: 4-hydroxyphenylpyruvate dioxygenase [Bacteroidia bacterium]|nr:4-hydroxyphenylpyruvate dioxygenase [Bacteroidia bacterium]